MNAEERKAARILASDTYEESSRKEYELGQFLHHALNDLEQQTAEVVRLREACIAVVDEYLRAYPTNIFIPPPLGQHGQTVDACSAAALRAILPNIARDIRALFLEDTPATQREVCGCGDAESACLGPEDSTFREQRITQREVERVRAVEKDIQSAAKEIDWAHEVLDKYGAPKTIYNPYDGCDEELNIAGRLACYLNPENVAGWRNPMAELAPLRALHRLVHDAVRLGMLEHDHMEHLDKKIRAALSACEAAAKP